MVHTGSPHHLTNDRVRWVALCATALLHVAGIAVAYSLFNIVTPSSVPKPLSIELITPPEVVKAEVPKAVELTPPPSKTPVTRERVATPRNESPATLPTPAPAQVAAPQISPAPLPAPAQASPGAVTAPPAPAGPAPTASERSTPAPNAAPAPAAAPSAAVSTPPQRSGPRVDASWAGNSAPAYPAMAKRMGDEGEVRLDVLVSAEGNVLEVKLKRTSGSEILDRAAMDAVKRWRFRPAQIDGKPVSEWYYNWIWTFKLES